MKARVVTLAVVVAFVCVCTFSALANPPQTPAPAKSEQTMAPAKKMGGRKPKAGKKTKAKVMRGVPSGVQACLDHLSQMAATEPMTPYEGHPEEIINNGLLWNDAKSKCSIGTDAQLRLKVGTLATAWRQKDAAKVKSLLEEIKSAAPKT
jgi:hypothetical protein